MTSWDDPTVIVGVAAILVSAGFALLAIYLRHRKEGLHVELERFEERLSPPQSPTETVWSIRVRPSKTMEHCKVIVGKMQIPVAKGGQIPLETKIVAGGAENFRIPISVNPFGDGDGQTVVAKEDKKKVKKQGFRKIPLTEVHLTVQEKQLASMEAEQERPRVKELIQRVLTPAIDLMESN